MVEWYTRQTQNLMLARAWGFKSPSAHQYVKFIPQECGGETSLWLVARKNPTKTVFLIAIFRGRACVTESPLAHQTYKIFCQAVCFANISYKI